MVARLVATALLAAALPATAGAAAHTRVARVSPLTKAGHVRPGLRVTTTKPGTCQPFSETVAGAYRCFSDSNLVLDPCWKAGAHTVVCWPSPWARTVTRMHVRGSLGRPNRGFAALPWAMRLRDGTRCVALQGATGVVAGRRISYGCRDGSSLAGRPNRRRRLWRIRRVDQSGGHFKLGPTATIATAYFGRA
jgi:hypothetical protein